MWFNDDDDEGFGFGGAPQQQNSMPGMLQGGGLTSLDPGMKMILLSQMMQGGNPMQSLTAISQMQGMQQRNQYQQVMLALKKKQRSATRRTPAAWARCSSKGKAVSRRSNNRSSSPARVSARCRRTWASPACRSLACSSLAT